MKMKSILHILLFVLFFNALYLNGRGQSNTMFWMKSLPQTANYNPAKQTGAKLFIDIPALPNFTINAFHTGFTVDDALKPIPSDTMFMIDLDGIENALNLKNNINFDFDLSILNLGFSIGNDMFASFGINYKANESFWYPKGLIEIRRLNYRENNTPLSFDFSQNLTIHREIFVGLSKDMGNGFTFGGRLKFLSGYANISTEQLKIDWYTETSPDSMYEWTFISDMNIRLSTPVDWSIQYDSLGSFQSFQTLPFNPRENISALIFPNNPGLAIDLGAEYNLDDRFIFSASIIDFGFIKWNSNPGIMTQNAQFRFSGIDVAKYISGLESITGGTDSLGQKIAQDMIDTIKTVFNPSIEESAYRTRLNSKIYLGVDAVVNDYLNIGVLYRGLISDKKLSSGFTLSANTNFLKGWSYSLTYSIMNGKANNVGMGLAYKVGPWQMYFITDNMAVPFWAMNESKFSDNWLKNTKTLNFAFGMNFILFNKKYDIGLLE
jgi:hypothetical protein